MKACPWCGRNNLDSDKYCFNCERDLNAIPGEEETLEMEQEIRRTRVYKPPSVLKLVLVSILRKVIMAILGMGAFFIFALVAIWVSYDNNIVAIVALGVLGTALLCALYYPDIKVSRRIGSRGIVVSLFSNIVILLIFLPPILWYLSSRGYIAGIWSFLGLYWWAILAFLLVGVIITWMAGRGASAETANP
jgi:hypothetical protein